MSAGPLLSNPRYWPFFWTQFGGAFNDNFFKNALVILVAYKTTGALGLDADQLVAAAGAIFVLPFFLFSALAGQLADKHDKAWLIRIIKLAEIGVMAIGAVGLATGSVELLLAVLFLMGTQSAFFGPVKYGVLPQLLDEDDIVGGNALVELATYLAILGGTIAGGVLVTLVWDGMPVGTWIVACGVVLIAIGGWFISRWVVDAPAVVPDLAVSLDPIRPTFEVVQIARRNPVVWRSVLGITWFWGFGSAFLSLFPPWTKDVLHGNETIATLFLATFSVGIGIGSMICEKLSWHRLELGLVPIGSFGMTVFTLDLFLVGEPWPAGAELYTLTEFLSTVAGWRIVIDLLGLSIFGGMYIVPLYTLIQLRAEPEERSRTIAANNIVNSAFMVAVGVALVGVQTTSLTVPQIFALLALLNACVALYIYTVVPEFLLRFCAWMLSNVMYRVRVTGHEHIPKDGPAVVVCNHVSFVDWLILMGAIKRPVMFVMHHSFAKLPVIGFLSRQAGVIPIASAKEPGGQAIKEAAFDAISQRLQEGWMVGIFPEGTITRTGEFSTFRPGVELIVQRDPCPVVPMALNGLWGSWFSRQGGQAIAKPPRRFWARIGLTITAPVPAADVDAEDLQQRVHTLWEPGDP